MSCGRAQKTLCLINGEGTGVRGANLAVKVSVAVFYRLGLTLGAGLPDCDRGSESLSNKGDLVGSYRSNWQV